MNTYRVYDQTGSGITHDIEAETLAEAVEAGRKWIEGGNWESHDGTIRIGVPLAACVRPVVEDEDGDDITLDQPATDCSGSYSDEEPGCDAADGGEHDWRARHALVGGIRENPGVWSLGGTRMWFRSVCACCGHYRTEDRAGSNRNHDEPEALVRHEGADEASEAWVARLRGA